MLAEGWDHCHGHVGLIFINISRQPGRPGYPANNCHHASPDTIHNIHNSQLALLWNECQHPSLKLAGGDAPSLGLSADSNVPGQLNTL